MFFVVFVFASAPFFVALLRLKFVFYGLAELDNKHVGGKTFPLLIYYYALSFSTVFFFVYQACLIPAVGLTTQRHKLSSSLNPKTTTTATTTTK